MTLLTFREIVTVSILIGMFFLLLGIYLIRHAQWKGDEFLFQGRIYVFIGIIAIVGCIFFCAIAKKQNIVKTPSWYIEKGYTIYLDGIEVDSEKINVNAYNYKADDENKYLILW